MDITISRLIDGSFELSRHEKSEDWSYWIFSKDVISSNLELQSFLETNKDLMVQSLDKKEYPQLKPYVDYNVPLVKVKDKEYLVHDKARIILFNYCVFLLKNDIDLYIQAVNASSNDNIQVEGQIEQKRFSYLYDREAEIERQLFSKLKHPNSLKKLLQRLPHTLWFKNDRKYVGLKPLESAIDYSLKSFDYSKLEI